MKFPSLQFYPGDWMKDPELRSVSYASRGLWIDMLSMMHESDRRGYLQLNGLPVSAAQLARMTGGATNEVTRLLRELENSGVFSRTDSGIIYSRRMTRDERKRQLCGEAGKKGGGNPALTYKGNPKGPPKGHSKGEIKASISSSSSSSSSDESPQPPFSKGASSGGEIRKTRRELRAEVKLAASVHIPPKAKCPCGWSGPHVELLETIGDALSCPECRQPFKYDFGGAP